MVRWREGHCRSEGYPYGIFGPWARWGWGLDGLGKLFRRRRRRRRRRRPWAHLSPPLIL